MSNMKKIILSAAVVAMVTLTASAQKEAAGKDLKFSVGVTAGLPVGDLKNASSFAIGGDIQGEYAAAESLGITLSAGYLNFTGKNNAGSTGLIPVLAGAKFNFTDKIYGHAQLGMSFSTESGGGSAFTYAPSVGYLVSENFDIALKYQAATKNSFTTAFFGIRAAYSF
jgi:hypothetical protein